MGEWKAVPSPPDKAKDKTVVSPSGWPIELFKLSSDIGEEHDLAAQHPDVVAKVKDIMQKARVDIKQGTF